MANKIEREGKYMELNQKTQAYMRAWIASKINDRDEALVGFKVLADEYDRTYAMLSCALLEISGGNKVEAIRYLKRIIEKEKEDMDYILALYLYSSILSQIEKDEDVVIEAYQNAINVYEALYDKDKSYGFVLEFAIECYRFLGDKKNQEKCKERLEEFYRDMEIDR